MRLTKKQFEKRLKGKKLAISLIGMSNVGKTFWAQKLKKNNFKHLNCDSLIEKKLRKEFPQINKKGVKMVGKWLGQPYEVGFKKREEKYLSAERKVTEEFLSAMKKIKKNCVIDTTGSIIHLSQNLQTKLKRQSLVVYLKNGKKDEKKMLKNYFKYPKPVIWKNYYSKLPHLDRRALNPAARISAPKAQGISRCGGKKFNENNKKSLERCYKKLLAFRTKRYEKLADVTIKIKEIKNNILLIIKKNI